MSKVVNSIELSKTLDLNECQDGFWLWDETQSINLSMRAKTERVALVEALTYYQERLQKVEKAHKSLSEKVDAFIAQFVDEEDQNG